MKKLFLLIVISLFVLGAAPQAYAANHVSHMATTMGGKHVAMCAQMMDRGVSECARNICDCEHMVQ